MARSNRRGPPGPVTVLFDQARAHLGVAVDIFGRETLFLPLPGGRTRIRMVSEDSPPEGSVRSLNRTAGTSTWMSMRSSRGPEILAR